MIYEISATTSVVYHTNWSYPKATRRDSRLGDSPVPQSQIFVSPALVKLIKHKTAKLSPRKRFFDHYLWFCGNLYFLKHSIKENREKDFVSVNYKLISTIISKMHYADIIHNLTVWGIIACDNQYIPGEKSKGYKILPPYDKGAKKYLIKDTLLNQKLHIFRNRDKRNLQEQLPSYAYLQKTIKRIQIDHRAASRFNTINYSSPTDQFRFETNSFSITALSDGYHFWSVDDFGHRAHTNLTTLPKLFRRYLLVEGSKLGQVDIKNSQPLFFYMLIRDEPSIPASEKEAYRHLVENGVFYEYFMERFRIPAWKREKYKRKILTALFFDVNRGHPNRYTSYFREQFPGIGRYISEMKHDDYKAMSKLLQRTESKFVIEKVVGRFIERYGEENEFISTIHDSVVTKVNRLPEAHAIMMTCFQEEGVCPILETNSF